MLLVPYAMYLKQLRRNKTLISNEQILVTPKDTAVIPSRQIFHRDILQVLNSILVNNLNLEIWEIDDEALLNFLDAGLQQIVRLILGHI
jgi:hypothetical protein